MGKILEYIKYTVCIEALAIDFNKDHLLKG